MSKEMNKVVEYDNYKFNIKVELNAINEKRIDGKQYHRVTITNMGSVNWFHTKNVLSEHLRMCVSDFQILAQDFVSKKDNRTNEEKVLSDIGFS